MLIICASEPRNTSFRVSSSLFSAASCFALWFLMRIVQIFDYSGFNRAEFTVAVAECTYSASISTSLVTIYPSSRFTNSNPSQPPFQHSNAGFRPVHQTDVPPYPAQDTLEIDGRMAAVPLFNHSNIPVSLFPIPETYVNNPGRGRYLDCFVNSHGSLYPYDPECLCTFRLLVGVDSQTPFLSRQTGPMRPYPRRDAEARWNDHRIQRRCDWRWRFR